MRKMTTYHNDKVRIQNTLFVGTVVKVSGGYSHVKFENGSEIKFSQNTGKEYHGNRYITVTNNEEFAIAAAKIAESDAILAEKNNRKAHNEKVQAAVNAEHFKRFMKFDGAEIVALTELEGNFAIVFKAKSTRRWNDDEMRLFTLVYKQEKELDRELYYARRSNMRGAGAEELEQLYEECTVDGYRAVLGEVGVETSSSRNRGPWARTMDMAFFLAAGDTLVREPLPEVLGMSYRY